MCRWCGPSLIADRLTAGFSRPSRRRFLAYAASAGVATVGVGGARASNGVDVIFRNGAIYPMTAGIRPVEALAIGGGKILAVGTTSDVSALSRSTTRVVDLGGRVLFPGFIDPHHHTILSALLGDLLIDVGYAKYPTRSAAIAAIKAAALATPPGDWVAAGVYDNLLQGGDLSKAELDEVSAGHPIFVLYVNGHVGAANTMALDRAKIPGDVGELPGGGHFGRGSDGKLNGLVYEEPALMRLLGVAIPKTTPELIAKALGSYTKRAASAGNTTLHEPGTVKPEWVEALAETLQHA